MISRSNPQADGFDPLLRAGSVGPGFCDPGRMGTYYSAYQFLAGVGGVMDDELANEGMKGWRGTGEAMGNEEEDDVDDCIQPSASLLNRTMCIRTEIKHFISQI
ncbi:hypothetical protein BY996DRAFT_6517054 [Phakopsora pachyrhizi]|nr:hypothetical protein BY996DRAFT_6517054 [Phakopsora pachyrhizi]